MGTDKFRRTTQFNGPVTFGYDDTGYDIKFHGATAGASLMWDESGDEFVMGGNARVYDYFWIGPMEWDVTNASAHATCQMNSMFPIISMDATEAASGTVNIYAWHPAPDNFDSSASFSACVVWGADTAQATQTAEITLNASMYSPADTGDAGTTYAGTATKLTAGASDANMITVSSLATDIDVPAVGDMMGFHIDYASSGSSTTGSDFMFVGLKIGYTKNKFDQTL